MRLLGFAIGSNSIVLLTANGVKFLGLPDYLFSPNNPEGLLYTYSSLLILEPSLGSQQYLLTIECDIPQWHTLIDD